jgi:uncharacterized protein
MFPRLTGLILLSFLLLTGCWTTIERKSEVTDATNNSEQMDVNTIRQNGNHLLHEASSYLQQHAYNPLNWYPWSEEALTLAREENKPIFLSIGYASCHWCHVMEEEVFENDTIAAYMNEHFISIKIDREERPDLDAVYMQAVQLLTGRGGWPLSVFLTPELQPFYGGTYFPAEQFTQLTRSIVDLFENQPDKVKKQGAELAGIVAESVATSAGTPVTTEQLQSLTMKMLTRVDWEWGGFQGQHKFPTPPGWLFLLHQYRRHGEERLGRAIILTLDRMADGGIHDQIGGGFHRYTVEPTWLIPHFEKMLYDNAQLASLYLEAAAVFDSKRYEQVAAACLNFMISDLHEPGGGFFASYDADTDGEEGTTYSWTEAELVAVAGSEDGAALALLLGVTAAGNFEGSNVLTRRSNPELLSAQLKRDPLELGQLFDSWQPALLTERKQRVQPLLDKKVVTAWNGLTISALSRGYIQFGEASWLKAAEEAADLIWQQHRTAGGQLTRTSTGGVTGDAAILDDYTALADGLLDLFQASGNLQYLSQALELLNQVKELFYNPDGGYYLTAENVEAPLGRQVEIVDSVEPSGNGQLALVLLKAAALTGQQEYSREAERLLGFYTGFLLDNRRDMSTWRDAANLLTAPLYELIIAGDPEAEATRQLLTVFHELAPSFTVLITVAAVGPTAEQLRLLPSTLDKIAVDGVATAYLCEQGSCQLPTSDPAILRGQLLGSWRL